MRTLYFGPARNLPSWYWVGKDIAEHLAADFDVRYFSTVSDIAQDAIVFWIKAPMAAGEIELARMKRLRIIYFPVDQYAGELEIENDREFIDFCSIIALHTPELAPAFPGSVIAHVDHYNKYGVADRAMRTNGRKLWIGGLQYLPYVYQFLSESGLLHSIKIDILTDHRCASAMAAAGVLCRQLNLPVNMRDILRRRELNVMPWSEARQRQLLLTCAGAFDVKHPIHFRQRHKPPTKMQKYLCSGIPCAINRESHLFTGLGFEVCDPRDVERWESADYRQAVEAFGRELAPKLTRQAIAVSYIKIAAPLLGQHRRACTVPLGQAPAILSLEHI